ncbi:metal-sensing transcriptional repressor [Caulobacter sp. RHG1]|uniref:metal/formaldehyde-sensitive transcriptional repressor n=1 Tax=Caulobacter sp. (strain RHG1) TaxID=2545762 RepID=UPI001555AFC8|nr:putative alpha helix chain yaiN [Caulobacter sp. RHG1]
MAHTLRDKTKLLNRVRRIKGQVEAIERALDEEKECAALLQLIAASRGAIGGLMVEVVEDHIACHLADPALTPEARKQGADELIDVLRSYLK